MGRRICLGVMLFSAGVLAQTALPGPANPKAKKTYADAQAYASQGEIYSAYNDFRNADKQDGGHCLACQQQILRYALALKDWKAAQATAREVIAEASGDVAQAAAHQQLANILMAQAVEKKNAALYQQAHAEFTQALSDDPADLDAMLQDGQVLARMNQDDAAKAEFRHLAGIAPAGNVDAGRAQRYLDDFDLTRARMAPAFAVTTLSGQKVALDQLAGKVVLLDFWASWCAPCRAALPKMQKIARDFQGQPLVILSISLDSDAQAWKSYVARNHMTWMNYWDQGAFTGPIATLYGVEAIPQTFSIDANGVMQDQEIADSSIEGKLKKLVAEARQGATAR